MTEFPAPVPDRAAERVFIPYEPWEYVVRSMKTDKFEHLPVSNVELTSKLDAEGAQEWELVAFDFATDRAIFKRKRRDK